MLRVVASARRNDSAADAEIDDAVLTQAMASDVTEEFLAVNGDPIPHGQGESWPRSGETRIYRPW